MSDKKVAFVTGAGKGIGKAVALGLAKQGVNLIVSSRTESDLIELKSEAEKSGVQLVYKQLDVRNIKDLEALAQTGFETFGRIDYLIANAGVAGPKSNIEEGDAEKWASVIDINLTGVYNTVKSTLPYLKKNNHAKILVVGSGLGHRGQVENIAYSASKAGIWMFTRLLAQELVSANITVNEIIPGPVKTEIDRNNKGNSFTSNIFSTEWIKTPDDVFPLFNFLLSQPEKGPTGQSFSLTRRDL